MTDLIEKARKFAALAEQVTPTWRHLHRGWQGIHNDKELYIAAAPEIAKLLGEMADRLERYEKGSG